jgi:CBS domain containing-hemolysin-like protein
MGEYGGLLALVALVLLNAFFVATEFALVSMRRTRITQLVATGSITARVLQEETTNLTRYIAATQLGVTLASLGLGFLGEPAVEGVLEHLLFGILPFDENVKRFIGFVVSFALVTYITILFGELVPKSLSIQQTERVAMFCARPLRLFFVVCRPLIALLNASGNGVLRLFGLRAGSGEEKVHSPEELELLIRETGRAGLLHQTEIEMLERVFDFTERSAYAVMVPRVDLAAIEVTASLDELLRVVTETRYTRYPVYEGSLDNVVGVLNIHDLLTYLAQQQGQGAAEFRLRDLLSEALFMPEGSSLEQVFVQMKSVGNQLVFLVDEYGGTSGAIASEDIVEEVFGEMEDEFDVRQGRVSRDIKTQGDGSLLVSGRTALDRLNERLHTRLSSRYATSLGGWMLEHLNRLPSVGEKLTIPGYTLEVAAMKGRRVMAIRITRRTAQAAE